MIIFNLPETHELKFIFKNNLSNFALKVKFYFWKERARDMFTVNFFPLFGWNFISKNNNF